MTHELFRHQWLSVLQDERAITYVKLGDGAGCIPVNDKGEVLLISEYAAAFGENALLFPGGGVAAGESLAETANRELQEEAGFKAGRLDFLATLHPLTKYLHVQLHVFLARDLLPSRLQGDEKWEIAVHPTPLDNFEPLIQTGRLRDSNVIAALYMARAFLQKEQAENAP